MAILHIDADAFFASVEQGFNPLLREKPVIVGGTETQRGVVHTASYEARAFGVRTGMPLAQAKQICPQAAFLKGNYQQYHAASLTMQDVYLNYTPAVEFTSLDDAYLDLNGAQHLYSSMKVLAWEIQREIYKALHIGVSVGIGKNKLVARIASGSKKPGGVVDIPPGNEEAFLHPLPVKEIPGIGRVAQKQLSELNIFTIGELAAIPKYVLNDLFGVNGLKMWDFANGLDHRNVQQRILPRQISRETTFEEDLTDRSIVIGTLRYLTERIAAKLRQQEQVCNQVRVKIRYSDLSKHQVSQTLPRATANAVDIFELIQKTVDRIPFRRIRIRHVGVQVSRIEWQNWQLNFFDESRKIDSLDPAVDEIRRKFGFTSILPADTLSLHQKYRMEKNGFVLHSPALTK